MSKAVLSEPRVRDQPYVREGPYVAVVVVALLRRRLVSSPVELGRFSSVVGVIWPIRNEDLFCMRICVILLVLHERSFSSCNHKYRTRR